MSVRKLAILAEDSPATRETAVAHLEQNGFEVFPFRNAKDVWSFLERRDEPVDLIASDNLVAGTDNFFLLEKIRSSAVHAQTPFVMIAKLEDKNALLSSMRSGVAACIAKPIAPEKIASVLKRISDTEPPRVRVLVVDDDPFFLKFTSSLLTKEGYAVEISGGSDAALDQIVAEIPNFDLVVCDIYMPDGSGFELLRSVRRIGIKIPFLLVSGDRTAPEQNMVVSRSSRLKFLHKDLLRVDLVHSVNQLLNQA